TSATAQITTYTTITNNLRLQTVQTTIPIMSNQFTVDINGNFYVTDPTRTAISVYNSAGTYLTSINSSANYVSIPNIVINQGVIQVDTAGNIWSISNSLYPQVVMLQGLGVNGKG